MGILEQVRNQQSSSSTIDAVRGQLGISKEDSISRTLATIQRKKEEEDKERLEKQQEALAAFNARQKEISQGNIFTRIASGVKSFLGKGETLPEIEGGSNLYRAQQQAQKYQQEYDKQYLGRLGNFISDATKGVVEKTKDAQKETLKLRKCWSVSWRNG